MSRTGPRPSFVGLSNQGATCYLNSLIQSLFLTPEFRQQLFSLTAEEVGLDIDTTNKTPKRKKIIVELQKLFARLQFPYFTEESYSNLALSTSSLTKAFGWDGDQSQNQHDINELYNLLLDGIEYQMPPNKKILDKYYRGYTINIIECQECKTESQRIEEFRQLNIMLEDQFSNMSFDSLHQSLMTAYMDNKEELRDQNAYFCCNCNKKVFAIRYTRLRKLPSIIVCNFNRFKFDFESGERVKIKKKFSFPKSLDLSLFVEHEHNDVNKADPTQYDLIAALVHRGNGAKAGHYHAFIRDMNNEVVWKPEKRIKKKRRSSPANTAKRGRNMRNNRQRLDQSERQRQRKEEAITVLVSILSEHGVLTFDQLNIRLRKLNNLQGWKAFERDLGKFRDFLEDNHRFTILNPEKRTFSVRLANDPELENQRNNYLNLASTDDDDTSSVNSVSKNKNNKKGNHKKRKNKKNQDFGVFGEMLSDSSYHPDEDQESSPQRKARAKKNKEKSTGPKRGESQKDERGEKPAPDDPHWFDFNDEDITAVFESEINELYDGGDEECPYMVIYRRKCMDSNAWPPEIPLFARKLLIDEPLDAEENKMQLDLGVIKLNMESKIVRKSECSSDSDNDIEITSSTSIDAVENKDKPDNNRMDQDDDDGEDDGEDHDVDMHESNLISQELPPKVPSPGSRSKSCEVIVLSSNEEDSATIVSPEKENLNCNHHVARTSLRMTTKVKPRNHKKRKYAEISSDRNNDHDHVHCNNININNTNNNHKKRKLADNKAKGSLANLPNPSKSKPNNRQSKPRSKSQHQPAVVRKKFVKAQHLEAIPMTKGSSLQELYSRLSEWTKIPLDEIQIARVLSTGRKYYRNPVVINLKDKDQSIKLKRVPLQNRDYLFVWNAKDGDLSKKELERRKKCIEVKIFVKIKQKNNKEDNEGYPRIFYLYPEETLQDLCKEIVSNLTEWQREKIEESGRFRDADTRNIFRTFSTPVGDIARDKKCVLCFEPDRAPQDNEIVIRYRLKTRTIRARQSAEEELYINENEETTVLKTLMASKFDVDGDKYELKRARNDWGMTGARLLLSAAGKHIEQLNFDKTQKLLLIETVDSSKRYLDVYCEVEEINGVKRFKIPKKMLVGDDRAEEKKQESVDSEGPQSSYIANGFSNADPIKRVMGNKDQTTNNSNSSNLDVNDEKGKGSSSQNVTPEHDGMDIYDANSELFCTLYLNRKCSGYDVKCAIRDCREYGLGMKLDPKIDARFYRVSLKQKRKIGAKWTIMSPDYKLPLNAQKCIVEFFDEPRKDNQYGNPNGRCLVFVHKYVQGHENTQHAVYGSRFEIELLIKQRRSLPALKNRILNECGWKDSMKPEHMVLAIRDVVSHKWTILSVKLQTKRPNYSRSGTKQAPKEEVIEQRIWDRDVIAVLDTSIVDETMKQHITAEMFETEWDKFCFREYQKKDDDDEPELIINFRNDSQDDQEESNGNCKDTE